MLTAVHGIHDARVVHGDLKPANFVFVRGTLKVIDFGIAKGIRDDTVNITRDTQTGTLNYIPPEALVPVSGSDGSQYKTLCQGRRVEFGMHFVHARVRRPTVPRRHAAGAKNFRIMSPCTPSIPRHSTLPWNPRFSTSWRVVSNAIRRVRPTIATLLAHPYLAGSPAALTEYYAKVLETKRKSASEWKKAKKKWAEKNNELDKKLRSFYSQENPEIDL